MNIQLLWFAGCPHVDAARAALSEAMRRAQVSTPVEDIDVSAPGTPAALRGWGSPTVLVDGRDVAGTRGSGDAMACRLYPGGGAPSVGQIERVLRAAAAAVPRSDTAAAVSPLTPAVTPGAPALVGGSALLAGVLASACCLGPALLATLGLSGAGLATALAPWRPALLVVTGLLVALGLVLSFRRGTAQSCDCPAPRTRRFGRWMMVGVAVVTVAAAAYPALLPVSREGWGGAVNASATTQVHIEGITCAACAVGILRTVRRDPGAGEVTLDTDRGVATIHYDPAATTPAALAAAISAMPGYTARVVAP